MRKYVKISVLFFACFIAQLLAHQQNVVAQNNPKRVISSYLKALKSLNHDRMNQYWAEEVILRSPNGSERTLDREFMREMRDFEREMNTLWSYRIKQVAGERVTVEMMEKNDFYDLLGVGKRTQVEVYFVRGGRIYRSETSNITQENGEFGSSYERFKEWLSKSAAAQDGRIMREGHLIFDGESAKRLRPWLKLWSIERTKPATVLSRPTPNESVG